MTMGQYLIEKIDEELKDIKNKMLLKNLEFVKKKFQMYLDNSIKQYNGNIERGTDEFICRNFLNFFTDYNRYFVDDKIQKRQLNKIINLLWNYLRSVSNE